MGSPAFTGRLSGHAKNDKCLCVQPSRPEPIPRCFFSSLKTLGISAEAITPRAAVNIPEDVLVGLFSGGHHLPLLGDQWGRGDRLWLVRYANFHFQERPMNRMAIARFTTARLFVRRFSRLVLP